MTKKKISLVSAVFASFFLIFSACPNNNPSAPESDEFEVQLRALPNVASVEKFTKESTFHGSTYTVYFNSLLDPSDPSKGTFRQKAYIGFAGYDKPNCLTTCGYSLSEILIKTVAHENEVAYILKGNLIAVEHRYSGESVRTDKERSYGNYDGTYWEYLSTENAAEDLHAIISSLKTLLSGKWLAQGTSKSGLTANLLCYYHPEDLDLTVPYCAPLCNGKYDPRLSDFLYNSIGDDDMRYNSTGDASSYRELLKNIQVWFLERRDAEYENGVSYKQKLFDTDNIEGQYYNKDYLTPDTYYDDSVSNFPIGIWMYKSEETFEEIKNYYALPNDDDKLPDGEKTKKEYFFDLIKAPYSDEDITPYSIQSFTEIGNYKLPLANLREVVKEARAKGKDVKLVIPEEKQNSLEEEIFLSPAELAFCESRYNNNLYQKMSEWIKTTDEQFIMLYGISDPWYSVRINDVERDNVHIFVHPSNNHLTAISFFPKEQRDQIRALLEKYMY